MLDLVAEGLDNREIAARLGKSAKTVRNQNLDQFFDEARACTAGRRRSWPRWPGAWTHDRTVRHPLRAAPVGAGVPSCCAHGADGRDTALSPLSVGLRVRDACLMRRAASAPHDGARRLPAAFAGEP